MSNLNTSRYQRVLVALGDRGARTWAIASRLHLTTPTARRRLKVLEAAGKVRRSERYSYDNDIYWERTPPAESGASVAAAERSEAGCAGNLSTEAIKNLTQGEGTP